MAFFTTKKKEEVQQPGFAPLPTDVPVDKVINLKKQGLNNNQIVQSLQREGYRTDQVFDAMNQSDLKGGIDNMPMQNDAQYNEMPQQQPAMQRRMEMPQMHDSERVEEIAEAIIDEKWRELTKNIDKIIEWKDKTEARINSIEQEFEQLKKGFDSLHTAILGKVSEYDQNIINLGAEIKAMEKIFQKLIPTFVENVSELTRITQKMKTVTPK
ncbi:hypothetical protein JXA85_05585 [Candidatus Woesearchaeota archaeon]|nr:hypothetical protein [Candidatus Woesearchaeota archaeon]